MIDPTKQSDNFRRGAQAAYATADICDQATTDEILAEGGPDFKAGKCTDEPTDWHRGWDWAIRMARQQL